MSTRLYNDISGWATRLSEQDIDRYAQSGVWRNVTLADCARRQAEHDRHLPRQGGSMHDGRTDQAAGGIHGGNGRRTLGGSATQGLLKAAIRDDNPVVFPQPARPDGRAG